MSSDQGKRAFSKHSEKSTISRTMSTDKGRRVTIIDEDSITGESLGHTHKRPWHLVSSDANPEPGTLIEENGMQMDAQSPVQEKDDDSDLPDDFLEPLDSPIDNTALVHKSTLFPTMRELSGNVTRQFWRAGDYDGLQSEQSRFVAGGLDHVRVHPKFLHSNATSHKWALGAIAELLDNALDEAVNGATFVHVDMIRNPKNGQPMLMIEDNGGGMDPDRMRQCMSLGYSAKSKIANTIGQYGNGFKTSTMRLGADVIVFSRNPGKNSSLPTQSIGMLSYTFLTETGQEDIIVPIIDHEVQPFGLRKLVRGTLDDWNRSLETLTKWSPFSTEKELSDQLHQIKQQGTIVIVYNLWEDDQGEFELDFDADPHDIQLRGTNRDERNISMAERHPDCKHYFTYRHSLRSYASILYLRLPRGFRLILRGTEIKHHKIADDLMLLQQVTYKPQKRPEFSQKEAVAVVTVGFVKGAADHIDVQGFNVYNKNRLIKPFWRIWITPSSHGRGIVGVVEADFVEPAHDKQGFERTMIFVRLEAKLLEIQKAYWAKNCHKVGYVNSNLKKSGKSSSNADEKIVEKASQAGKGTQILSGTRSGDARAPCVASSPSVPYANKESVASPASAQRPYPCKVNRQAEVGTESVASPVSAQRSHPCKVNRQAEVGTEVYRQSSSPAATFSRQPVLSVEAHKRSTSLAAVTSKNSDVDIQMLRSNSTLVVTSGSQSQMYTPTSAVTVGMQPDVTVGPLEHCSETHLADLSTEKTNGRTEAISLSKQSMEVIAPKSLGVTGNREPEVLTVTEPGSARTMDVETNPLLNAPAVMLNQPSMSSASAKGRAHTLDKQLSAGASAMTRADSISCQSQIDTAPKPANSETGSAGHSAQSSRSSSAATPFPASATSKLLQVNSDGAAVLKDTLALVSSEVQGKHANLCLTPAQDQPRKSDVVQSNSMLLTSHVEGDGRNSSSIILTKNSLFSLKDEELLQSKVETMKQRLKTLQKDLEQVLDERMCLEAELEEERKRNKMVEEELQKKVHSMISRAKELEAANAKLLHI